MNIRIKTNQQGFTIAELMIATLVFSVILLIATTSIIEISHTYYKGINEANTQDTARSIMETIGQSIQFGGGNVTATPAPNPGSMQQFCVGNRQFSYKLGSQLVTGAVTPGQTNAALRVNTLSACNSGSTPQTSGQELLAPKMRLSDLSVTPITTGATYRVHVKVIYGDSDLLSNPTGPDAKCTGNAGSQFCSVSDISTIVYKRVP